MLALLPQIVRRIAVKSVPTRLAAANILTNSAITSLQLAFFAFSIVFALASFFNYHMIFADCSVDLTHEDMQKRFITSDSIAYSSRSSPRPPLFRFIADSALASVYNFCISAKDHLYKSAFESTQKRLAPEDSLAYLPRFSPRLATEEISVNWLHRLTIFHPESAPYASLGFDSASRVLFNKAKLRLIPTINYILIYYFPGSQLGFSAFHKAKHKYFADYGYGRYYASWSFLLGFSSFAVIFFVICIGRALIMLSLHPKARPRPVIQRIPAPATSFPPEPSTDISHGFYAMHQVLFGKATLRFAPPVNGALIYCFLALWLAFSAFRRAKHNGFANHGYSRFKAFRSILFDLFLLTSISAVARITLFHIAPASRHSTRSRPAIEGISAPVNTFPSVTVSDTSQGFYSKDKVLLDKANLRLSPTLNGTIIHSFLAFQLAFSTFTIIHRYQPWLVTGDSHY